MLLLQGGTVQDPDTGLVVRNGAPPGDSRVNVLHIAHHVKFLKTYGVAGHGEACPFVRKLSPCGALLGVPLKAGFKRSAC